MANVKCKFSDIYRPLLNAKLKEFNGDRIAFENFVNAYFDENGVRQIMDELNNSGGVGNDPTTTPLETPVEKPVFRTNHLGEIPKQDVKTTLYFGDGIGQNAMKRKFEMDMMSRCIFDPRVLLKGGEILTSQGNTGASIYDYKKSLFQTIYDFVVSHGFSEDIDIDSISDPNKRNDAFQSVLDYFSSSCIKTLRDSEGYNEAYECFSILTLFEDLIELHAPYIEIDKRYKSPYSEERYKYVGSKVKQFQQVFGQTEYMSASDSYSDLIKILLRNLPSIHNGKLDSIAIIGERAFSNIGSKLNNAILNGKLSVNGLSVRARINDEIWLTKNMSEIINSFIGYMKLSKTEAEDKTFLLDELEGLQKLIYSKSLINDPDLFYIPLLFTHTMLKQVPSIYTQYKEADVETSSGELVKGISPSNLTERFVRMQKERLDEKIQGQSYHWINNLDDFKNILNKLGIEIQAMGTGFKMIFKNSKSGDTHNVIFDPARNKWNYVEQNVNLKIDEDQFAQIINSLWKDLMWGRISAQYKRTFISRNKRADVNSSILSFLPLIATTINNVVNHKPGTPIKLTKCPYGPVRELAATLSIIDGADSASVIKNSEGNNLPLYQMRCLAYDHIRVYQKLLNESDGSEAINYNVVFNNIDKILSPKIRTEVVIGDGLSKKVYNTAKLDQQSIMHIAMGYDFLIPLFTKQNSAEGQNSEKCILGFQPHCFSDKNKHFIVQFDITNGWTISCLENDNDSIDGNNGNVIEQKFDLKSILRNFIKKGGGGGSEWNALKNAWRQSSKIQYGKQIDNILKSYQKVYPELNLEGTLLEKVNTLQEFLNNTDYNSVLAAFKSANVDFVDNVTGFKSKIKIGENEKTIVKFNETLISLYDNFKTKSNFDKFYKSQFAQFMNDSEKAQTTITSDPMFKKLFEAENIDSSNVWEAYFLMDTMFSTEYNKMMIGDVYMHPTKLKEETVRNDALKNLAKSENIDVTKVEKLIETDSKLKLKFELEKQKLESTYNLANRWVAQVKRMVIYGATFHSYCLGMPDGIPLETNMAVIEDMPDVVRNILGKESDVDSMDGAGFVSPLLSMMENRSLLDAAVKATKKTILHNINAKYGDPTLLKWAEYELNNTLRRSSWDSPVKAEQLFKKMHNRKFEDNVSINYEKVFNVPFIVEDPYSNAKTEFYGVRIEGQIGHRLDQNGNIIESFEIKCIYDIDQLFGGAWARKNGEWTNDGLTETLKIVCDNNLKDYMIGILANKSAVKVGARNINSKKLWTNDEPLWTTKMSLAFGGLQMDADHELDHAEVTEMTQMISALEQMGNTHNIATLVYEEIGKYCAESLKEVKEALNKESLYEKKDAIYQIYGKALIKAFNSGNKDTLGLAQSFIKAAQESINNYKINYQIPLSSSSINGIFNSTVTSDIVKSAIRRHYDGIASVLHPGFNMMQYYRIDGFNYRFDELKKVVGENLKSYMNPVFTDEPGMENLPENNKYVIPVTDENPVDFQDTVVIESYDDKNKRRVFETVIIDSYEKYLKYRNVDLKGKIIYKHTLRPRNLKGSDTIFKTLFVSKEGTSSWVKTMSVFETPESILLHFLNKFEKEFKKLKESEKKKYKNFEEYFKQNLKNVLDSNLELYKKCEKLYDSLSYTNIKNALKKELEDFLKHISNIPEDGITYGNEKIIESQVIPAEIAMGRLYAKQLGLKSTDSVADILKKGSKFFYNRLYKQSDIKNEDSNSFDVCLFREDGTPLYVKIGNFEGDLEEVSSRIKQVPNEYQNIDGKIWVGDKQICSAENKRFVKYIDSHGQEFDMCIVNDISTFENLKKSDFFEQIDYNFRIDNYEKLIDLRLKDLRTDNGEYVYSSNLRSNLVYKEGRLQLEKTTDKILKTDFNLLKQYVKTNDDKELFVRVLRSMNFNLLKSQNWNLAEKRFKAFQKSLRFVGTRIPCQSMTSFAPMQIAIFTDSDINEVYIPTMVCWLQGSDYDIDKQYLLGYSLSDNGTFSKSQSEWNKENLLKNKVVDGIFDVILSPSNQISLTMPVDTSTFGKVAEGSSAGEAANRMSPYCPSSKYRMQIENMVGKDCIGNVATAIKSFFALSNMYNQEIDQIYNLIVNGKEKEAKDLLKTLIWENGSEIKTLANVNTDKLNSILNQIKDGELLNSINLLIEFQNRLDDVSMVLGELLNCATDNAKELILKKINADSNWIDIYCTQLMLGYDVKTIANAMCGDVMVDIVSEFESSVFSTKEKNGAIGFLYNKIDLIRHPERIDKILSRIPYTEVENEKGELVKLKDYITLKIKEVDFKVGEDIDEFNETELIDALHYKDSEILMLLNKQFEKSDVATLSVKEINMLIHELINLKKELQRDESKLSEYEKILGWLRNAKEIKTLGKILKINQGLETDFADQCLKMYKIQQHVRKPGIKKLIYSKGQIKYFLIEHIKCSLNNKYDDEFDNFVEGIKGYYPKGDDITNLTPNYLKIYEVFVEHFEKYSNESELLNEVIIHFKNILSNPKFNSEDGSGNHVLEAWDQKLKLFDVYEFISNNEYADEMIECFEFTKENFNILKVMRKVPHFKEMLEAITLNRDTLSALSVRNAMLYQKFLDAARFNKDLDENKIKLMVADVDSELINGWIDSQQIEFPIFAGSEYWDVARTKNTAVQTFDSKLTSNEYDKENFKLSVEKLISYLKTDEEWADNKFLKHLELGVKKISFDDVNYTTRQYLRLNIDMMKIDNSVKNRKLYDEILTDFNKLQYVQDFEIDVNGTKKRYQYNIIDLLFVYNLIVNKDKFGPNSFTRLFEDVVNRDPERKLYISKFNHWIDTTYNPFDEILTKRNSSKSIETYGETMKDELENVDYNVESNLSYDRDDSDPSETQLFVNRLSLTANTNMSGWFDKNKLNLNKIYSIEFEITDESAQHKMSVNSIKPYLNGQKIILASNQKQLDVLAKIPAGKDVIVELRDNSGNYVNIKITKELGRLVSDNDLGKFGLIKKDVTFEENREHGKNFQMYSGKAEGSDMMWDEIAREFGITKIKHYTIDDYDNSLKIEGAEEEIEKAYIQSAKALGKNPSPKTKYVGKLVRRDYLQAKSADAIYAITGFESRNNKLVPMGGTAYAIMMGIDLGKDIYIWDIYENVWKTYDYKSKEFVQYKDGKTPPPLKHKFAGIGTRDIDPKRGIKWIGADATNSAIEAMEKLFEYNGFKRYVPSKIKYYDENGNLLENKFTTVSGNYYNDNMGNLEFDSEPNIESISSSFSEDSKSKIKLNSEQESAVNKAIDLITSNSGGQILIQGKAGTGKTTLVNSIVSQFPGLKIAILAPTNKAKNNIEGKVEVGIGQHVGFMTVASFLGNRINVFGELEEGWSRSKDNIIIIDEISMMQDKDRNEILSRNPDAIIIYLGDEGQLPPVGEKPSSIFSDNNVIRVNLTERVRQGEESPILPLTDPFWNYSVYKETGPLPELKIENNINSKGAVINSKSGSLNVVPKLIDSFVKSIEDNNPDFVKIVAGTNRAVDNYNRAIKEKLIKLGYYEKVDNFDFSVGETIIFTEPYEISINNIIRNSSEFKIHSISDEFEINVNKSFGTDFIIDPILKCRKVTIFVNNVKLQIPVLSSDSKKAFESHKNQILNKTNKTAFDAGYLSFFAKINSVYAITTHKAQGSTYEICALDVSNILGVKPWSNEEKAKCIYTGMTRPSNVLILLSDSSKDFDGDILDINNKINQNKSQKPIQNKTKSNEPVQFEGKMTYSYGSSKRSDVKSETTIEAIRNGERTATTRYNSDGNIDYWKQAKVGDIIRFEGKNKGDYVLVRVIKPLTKLDPNTSKEEWSRKEGWSEEYFDKKVKPKLNQAWQIEFEYVGSNPVQLELFSDNTYSIDSNPHTPELPKSTKLIRMVETLNNPYIKLVHDEDLVNESVTVQNSKGFVRNGIVYINLDRMNAGSTLIHELGHLYLGGLKAKFNSSDSKTPEEVKEYYKILSELHELPLWKQVRSAEEYSDKYGSDFDEEIATRLIERYFNGNLSTYKEEQIVKKLLSLLDKEFRDLVETASNPQFIDNLMGFSENYEVQQKIASLKRRLYQDGSIKETNC